MITYKKLTEAELDTFIGMRITQLTEEYVVSGKTPPEGVDLRSALEDFYNRHMEDGTFVSWHTTYDNKSSKINLCKNRLITCMISTCFFYVIL